MEQSGTFPLGYLIKHEQSKDLIIKFKETEEMITLHKAILASNSEVFTQMFYGEWKESVIDPKTGKSSLLIEDFDYLAIKEAVSFLYEGNISSLDNIDVIIQIISFSKKYLMNHLHKTYLHYIKTSIIPRKSVFVLLDLYLKFTEFQEESDEELESFFEKIILHSQEIFSTKKILCKFGAREKKGIQRILECGRLAVEEDEMLERIIEFAEKLKKDDEQEDIVNLLYSIRLNLLSQEGLLRARESKLFDIETLFEAMLKHCPERSAMRNKNICIHIPDLNFQNAYIYDAGERTAKFSLIEVIYECSTFNFSPCFIVEGRNERIGPFEIIGTAMIYATVNNNTNTSSIQLINGKNKYRFWKVRIEYDLHGLLRAENNPPFFNFVAEKLLFFY